MLKRGRFCEIGFVGMFMVAIVAAYAACANSKPLEVGVFAGVGPRSNGCVEWFRLVNSSPEMNLTLLDADDVRHFSLIVMELDAPVHIGTHGAVSLMQQGRAAPRVVDQ